MLVMARVMGPMRSTVVTLSRKADKTVVIKRTTPRRPGPALDFAALMAMYSKMPEFLPATHHADGTPRVEVHIGKAGFHRHPVRISSRGRATAMGLLGHNDLPTKDDNGNDLVLMSWSITILSRENRGTLWDAEGSEQEDPGEDIRRPILRWIETARCPNDVLL